MVWSDVEKARTEQRKELVITKSKVSGEFKESDGLDPAIFSLKSLNYLEINGISLMLTGLPCEISQLSNLTSLILRSLAISDLPQEISHLSKLKILDVSLNSLSHLPDSLSKLLNIESLLASNNQLECLPPGCSNLTNLHILDVSNNKLDSLDVLCTAKLVHLAEVRCKNNKLTSVPPTINLLVALKVLDLSENQLLTIPGELAQCRKLKEVELKGNKLKDNRFSKLVNQGKYKAILDYIHKTFPLTANTADGKGDGEDGGKGKGKKKKGRGLKGGDDVESITNMIKVLHVNLQVPTVTLDESVMDVRPHIVCCVVRDVDISKQHKFKKFIQLQTKLHDDPRGCDKRNAGTIATHDLSLIKGALRYEARPPTDIMIRPLFKKEAVSAKDLVANLRKEADDYRKEHKRNTFSGIHKYLDLLEGFNNYPCLVDEGNGDIVSFPPITNSDTTKISQNTKDMLVEVTSNHSHQVAKDIMESLLERMMLMHLSKKDDESDEDLPTENDELLSGKSPGYLLVQQVKTLDATGQLKLVYPSRDDLNFDNVKITRDY